MDKDFAVSWTDIHKDSKALAEKLRRFPAFKGIVAVTRGGLVPACQIGYELDIRLVETISIASYNHQSQSECVITKYPESAGDGTGWLVVDELSDTGNTFRTIREILPAAHFACLYAKPQGAAVVDTYIKDVPQDTWIHLPWDDLSFPPHIRARIGGHLDD